MLVKLSVNVQTNTFIHATTAVNTAVKWKNLLPKSYFSLQMHNFTLLETLKLKFSLKKKKS